MVQAVFLTIFLSFTVWLFLLEIGDGEAGFT